MKIQTCKIATISLLAATTAVAQDPVIDTKSATTSSIFEKGTFEFIPLKRNLDLSFLKDVDNGQAGYRSRELSVDVRSTYFFVDHFGIGLDLNYEWSQLENGTKVTYNKFMGYVDLTYGTSFGNFNAYARAGVGYGKSTQKATNTADVTADKFGLKFEIGTPIFLDDQFYVIPNVSYFRSTINYDDGEERKSGFKAGLKFGTYLECDEMCEDGPWNYYGPGHSFLSYSTKGLYKFGNTETDFGTGTQEGDFSRLFVGGSYNIYVLPNVAVGTGVRFSNQVQKSEPDFEFRRRSIMVVPRIITNLPVTNNWNHMFLQVETGIGSSKTVTEIGTNSTTVKADIFNISAGLGYNFRFGEKFTITPVLEYDWNSRKDENSGIRQKNRGLSLELGINRYF